MLVIRVTEALEYRSCRCMQWIRAAMCRMDLGAVDQHDLGLGPMGEMGMERIACRGNMSGFRPLYSSGLPHPTERSQREN